MATKKALGRSECAHSEHEIIRKANANCEVDEAKRLLCNHLHEVMMTHVTVKEKYASWFDENDDDTSAD